MNKDLPKVSLFYGGSTNTHPAKSITWFEVIDLFTIDENIKKLIENIRQLMADGKVEEAKALKLKLPYITPAGEFTYRRDKNLKDGTYSWVCPVDIDAKDNPTLDWDKLFITITNHQSVFLCVRSPRGNGIKALVWLKHNKYDPQQQYIVFRDSVYPHLEKLWGCKLDNQQGVLSQPFFVTHDGNAYVNKKAIPLDIDYESYQIETVINGEVHYKDSGMKPFAVAIQNRINGKWSFFGQIAYLVGGLYAGKVIKSNANPLQTLLNAAARNKFVENLNVAESQIKKSFEAGQKEPITQKMLNVKNAMFQIIQHLNKPLLKDYIRVGGKYYKRITKPDRYGHRKSILDVWPKEEIKLDFGFEGLYKIPGYDAFVIEPNNIEYNPVIDNCYNLYNTFIHKPEPGDFNWSLAMVKHVFGEQYDLGLDYMKVLYLFPKQILPVIAIVSLDQNTGKTTFLNWLSQIFGDNLAIIRSEDLISDFTSLYAGKNIICVDETILDKSHASSRLKNISTAKQLTYNEKWGKQASIPFFGKVILATNKETDFMKVEDEDIRYWVLKINKPAVENVDMDDALKIEIPAFLNFLKERPFSVDREHRMWFKPERIQTEALLKVRENSKKGLYKDLLEVLQNYFDEGGLTVAYGNPVDIKRKFFERKSIDENYIRKVLKDDFKYSPEPQMRYTPFDSANNETSEYSEFNQVNQSKTGTPFKFEKCKINELYNNYCNV